MRVAQPCDRVARVVCAGRGIGSAAKLFTLTALLACLAPPAAQAAEFECTLDGFTAALEAAAEGDAGPHRLACTPADRIGFDEGSWPPLGTGADDLDLDGGGVTLECQASSPASVGCYPALSFAPRWICTWPTPVLCGVTDGPAPTVRLSRFVFAKMGISATRGAELVLERVVLEQNFDIHLIRPFRAAISVVLSSRAGEQEPPMLRVSDSTISHGISLVAATAVIDRSLVLPSATGLTAAVDQDSSLLVRSSTIYGAISSLGFLDVIGSTLQSPLYHDGYFTRLIAAQSLVVDSATGCEVLTSSGRVTFVNSILAGGCVLQPTQLAYNGIPGWPGVCDAFVAQFPETVTVVSHGGNLEAQRDTCRLTDPTDLVLVTAEELKLEEPADHGGPSWTSALQEGSLAIDSAVTEECLAVDQRGFSRPQGAGCDRGAFEVPEPGAALLGASALAAISWLRRRRFAG